MLFNFPGCFFRGWVWIGLSFMFRFRTIYPEDFAANEILLCTVRVFVVYAGNGYCFHTKDKIEAFLRHGHWHLKSEVFLVRSQSLTLTYNPREKERERLREKEKKKLHPEGRSCGFARFESVRSFVRSH